MSSRTTIPECQPLGHTKALVLYSVSYPLPSASGNIHCNAPGLSCHLGADILVCRPRSHVIYV